MTIKEAFVFVDKANQFNDENALVGRIDECLRTPKELFDVLYQSLSLPSYFGFNWNALFDCLRDFHWISQERVIIVHERLPELESSEMRIYLEVLHDAILNWQPGEEHSVQAVFNACDRNRVEALMA
ncbi:barstar family protein [Caballeronia sp. LZ033]|uniref:barstar family protein n=1 Tax=Caballeronia sp. LZ033 TaxID=3038566 RepID=UPI0028639013|nr:barstar family protein [Caballeronia sp. LZ033]MDR5815741.1 barstar family protein [Caballeronia sp. LZ033]